MKTAKYYIYRNLRTGGFSIRHRGLVIDHQDHFTARSVKFRVLESGRQRVIQEQRKNVHAFVIADSYSVKQKPKVDTAMKVSYNPYTQQHFCYKGKEIHQARSVIFKNGSCFIKEL